MAKDADPGKAGADGADGGDGSDGSDGDGGDGEVTLTSEEIAELQAENERYKKSEAKRKTEAARAAKAEKDAARKKAEGEDDVDALKEALAEEKAAREASEMKANRAQARAIAKELGAANPAVAVRVLDLDSLDDAGDEDEVTAALTQLLKDEPYLKGAKVKTDGGEGGKGNAGGGSMSDLIRQASGRG